MEAAVKNKKSVRVKHGRGQAFNENKLEGLGYKNKNKRSERYQGNVHGWQGKAVEEYIWSEMTKSASKQVADHLQRVWEARVGLAMASSEYVQGQLPLLGLTWDLSPLF